MFHPNPFLFHIDDYNDYGHLCLLAFMLCFYMENFVEVVSIVERMKF
jgi:hypothetical protein